MAKSDIKTLTGNTTDGDWKSVTGTDSGSKRLLDVSIADSSFPLPNTGGSSAHYNGSVGTTSVSVPSTAGASITSFLIENTHNSQNLLFSLDGGSTFKTVLPGDAYVVSPRGDLTQITLQGSAAGTTYEIIMNRKA